MRHNRIRSDINLRVRTLHKRLEDIFELLALWQHYVEIIYMPEWEVNVLKSSMDSEARSDDASIHAKMRKHDIQQRLNLLFGPDEKKPVDKSAGQESVHEDLTSDT